MVMILAPLIYAVVNSVSRQYNSPNDLVTFQAQFYQFQFYTFWLLNAVGHIFFIVTIVKSFSQKQETIIDEQAPGLLDEFAD
jgi:uncharacterized membrane protein